MVNQIIKILISGVKNLIQSTETLVNIDFVKSMFFMQKYFKFLLLKNFFFLYIYKL